MSTPNANGTPKPTPRMGSALTPSATTPSRNIASPAHLSTASSKTFGRSPWKGAQSAGNTPLGGPLNMQTPTPHGILPPGSSPAVTLDGSSNRARAGTAGAKSLATTLGAHTPAGLSDLGLGATPLAGGINGAPQLVDTTVLDNLGLVGRDAEAWTQQRIREIVDLLGTRWGKVSQENVKRCVDRIGGLECYWEDHLGGKEKVGERKRTLAIAGNEMMLEISWLGERVTRVVLNFMRGNEVATDELGGDILQQNLVGTEPGYVDLTDFVENLNRLARIDQLGRVKVSCFEALEGVGESLKRLWELQLAKEQETTKHQAIAGLRTLCERSGRPMTHSDGKIGWRQDYWIDRRLIAEELVERGKSSDSIKNPFTLLIDCEMFDATHYPSIRTSQAWLSPHAADAVSDPTISIWDDPPLTFIPGTQIATGPSDSSLGITIGTQPDVRYIARLRPAVTFPVIAAGEILQHLEAQETFGFSTYLGLLFPDVADLQDQTRDAKVFFHRSVPSDNNSSMNTGVTHRFEVHPYTSWPAKTITDLPFSHPRQLTDILPFLRQWAFFGRFLQRSYGNSTKPQISNPVRDTDTLTDAKKPAHAAASKRPPRPVNDFRHNYQHYDPPSDTDSEEDEQTNPISNTDDPSIQANMTNSVFRLPLDDEPEATVETSFVYSQIARRIDMTVSVTFLNADGASCSCAFDVYVHLNARLEIAEEISFHVGNRDSFSGSDLEREKFRKGLERALRISEDIGITAVWIARFLKRTGVAL